MAKRLSGSIIFLNYIDCSNKSFIYSIFYIKNMTSFVDLFSGKEVSGLDERGTCRFAVIKEHVFKP